MLIPLDSPKDVAPKTMQTIIQLVVNNYVFIIAGLCLFLAGRASVKQISSFDILPLTESNIMQLENSSSQKFRIHSMHKISESCKEYAGHTFLLVEFIKGKNKGCLANFKTLILPPHVGIDSEIEDGIFGFSFHEIGGVDQLVISEIGDPIKKIS